MEEYTNLGIVGEGTYGIVMKCRHKDTGQIVAIKKYKESDEEEQVRKTALREIRILKQLRHDNIVNLVEVFRRKGKLYLVFEYMDTTILERLDRNPFGLPLDSIVKYLYQIIKSLAYCHGQNIVHRDIKPENLLVSKNGVLKLCDFGFARTLEGAGARYTDYVSTRWYRAPELLVGDPEYGKAVDIWAIGCMTAELFNGLPLFPGESDIDQLFHIVKCFGHLSDRQGSTFQKNSLFLNAQMPRIDISHMRTLEMRLKDAIPNEALDFITMCLHCDPEKRATCEELLRLPLFNGMDEWYRNEFPLMMQKNGMILFSGNNNKRRIRKARDGKDRKREKENTADDENENKRDIKTKKISEDSNCLGNNHETNNSNNHYTTNNTNNGNGNNKSVGMHMEYGKDRVICDNAGATTGTGISKDALPNIKQKTMQRATPVGSVRDDIFIPPIALSTAEQYDNSAGYQHAGHSTAALPNLKDFQFKGKSSKNRKSKKFGGVMDKKSSSRNKSPSMFFTSKGSQYATTTELLELRFGLSVKSSQLNSSKHKSERSKK